MRHLIHALEGVGNYVEAERSLDAYLFIVENEKKTLAKTQKEHRDIHNEERAPDIDSDEVILQTMAAGIRLLVKYLGKGRKALDLAVKLEANSKLWQIKDPEVLAVVLHAVGIANSLWSMQSIVSH
jgi:hypothetical protein